MRKAICPKCEKLINIDENAGLIECPECHQQIIGMEAIKHFNRLANVYKRNAEVAFLGSTQYQKAYDNYSKLLTLAPNILNVLTGTSLSRLYCSDLHNIYIKEATDILLKGSDNVEIGEDNAKLLSEFLKKFKEDCLLIISSTSKYKSESKYSYNIYIKAINEFIYYLNAYLDIYNSLNKFNSHFSETKDSINKELESAKKLLNEKVIIKNNSESKQEYKDEKNKPVINIFPNKKKIYIMRMCLYGTMGLGFISAIVGLILLSTNQNDKIIPSLVAALGLGIFIGSYFVGNYLRRKNYNTTY